MNLALMRVAEAFLRALHEQLDRGKRQGHRGAEPRRSRWSSKRQFEVQSRENLAWFLKHSFCKNGKTALEDTVCFRASKAELDSLGLMSC